LLASVWIGGLADNLVIVGMRPNPEPHDAIVHVCSEGSVTISDPDRPEGTNALEVE